MAFGNLPQIDPSFLMQKQANVGDMMQAGLGGYQQGLQLKQQMDAQKFENALKSELATGEHDYTKPEGQASLIKALAEKGFGPEAMALASRFPKPAPKDYKPVFVKGGASAFDQSTGKYGEVNPNIQPIDPQREAFTVVTDKKTGNKFKVNKITGASEPMDMASPPDSDLPPDQQPLAVEPYPKASLPASMDPKVLSIQGRRETAIASANAKQTNDYEIAKRGALGFKADYENYKRALASGDKDAIKVAQQGMTDKYITTSTGKSTGEAQFKNFTQGQGLTNAFQNLGDKLMTGSMAPEKVFDAMNDITMSTAMKLLDKTKQGNDVTRKQVLKENKANGFRMDPEALIAHSPEMLSQDSTAYATPPKVALKPHPQDSEAVNWAKKNQSNSAINPKTGKPFSEDAKNILKMNGFNPKTGKPFSEDAKNILKMNGF